jgi:hypothetical protein
MNSRGVALLEVLIALAILGTVGLALVSLESAALAAERDARALERTLAAEERVLAALTLLKRGEFDRRLGRHALGEFLVYIERPEQTLYRIAVGPADAPQVEDLVTVVYRAAPR